MIIAGKYEVPDSCPMDCEFKQEAFYQGCSCTRCPVFNCQEPVTEEDKNYMPLVPAEEFRSDWAKDWSDFFKTGKYPELRMFPKDEEK